MKMSTFLLKSGAVFLLLLISVRAYAIPLVYNDIALPQDESTDNRGIGAISGVTSKSDETVALLLVSPHLGRPPGDGKLLSLANSAHGFALLFEFPSASGLQWPEGNLARFRAFGFLLKDAGNENQIDPSDDENEMINFLAMLGIVTAGWEPFEENSQRSHDMEPPAAAAPTGVRHAPRDACMQWHREQSNKHGWRESLCPDTGLVSTGFGGSGAQIGRGGIVTGGDIGGVGGHGRGPNGGNPGGSGGPGSSAGTGGSGGGGGPGGGGSGDGGSTGGGPGGGNGSNGTGSGSGAGGTGGDNEDPIPPSEVGTVPEPATLALVVLGFIGMCAANHRKRGPTSFLSFKG
jgi:hypothetical protein